MCITYDKADDNLNIKSKSSVRYITLREVTVYLHIIMTMKLSSVGGNKVVFFSFTHEVIEYIMQHFTFSP